MNEGMLMVLRPVQIHFYFCVSSLLFVRVLGSGGGDGRDVRWQDPGALISPPPPTCNLLTEVIIHESRLGDGLLPW